MLSNARRRTVVLFVGATLLVLLTLSVGAFVLLRDSNGIATDTAYQRAQRQADLLGRLGPAFGALDLGDGPLGRAPQTWAPLDVAIRQAQREGILEDLTIWNRSARVVYRAPGRSAARTPPSAEDLAAALRGARSSRREPGVFDVAVKSPSGVFNSLIPLRDGRGAIVGALEVSLPLSELLHEGDRIRSRVLLIVVVGGAALWLLLMPLTLRAARSAAEDWFPGRRRTLRAFRRGLRRGEIELAYQPQVDPRTGAAVAVEALVRWRRGGRVLAPGAFLAAVEGTRLMPALTEYVLDLALRELGSLALPERELRVSVNLSAQDLDDERLPERVSDALRRHAVPPSRLALEVTETAVIANEDRALSVLEAIRGIGVEVSVDDFGTGHASIARLQRLPVAEVKIDRSFVSADDDRSRFFVTAIVRFARELGLRVVAEGVEDAATLELLAELGCDLAQGYHVSPPLDAAAIHDWLAACGSGLAVDAA